MVKDDPLSSSSLPTDALSRKLLSLAPPAKSGGTPGGVASRLPPPGAGQKSLDWNAPSTSGAGTAQISITGFARTTMVYAAACWT